MTFKKCITAWGANMSTVNNHVHKTITPFPKVKYVEIEIIGYPLCILVSGDKLVYFYFYII